MFLARHQVDFRKGHSGILAEAYNLGLGPYSGDSIVFISKDRRKVKVLMADTNGLRVPYKKSPSGAMRTKLKAVDYPSWQSVSMPELAMVLDGARFQISGRPEGWPKKSIDSEEASNEDT